MHLPHGRQLFVLSYTRTTGLLFAQVEMRSNPRFLFTFAMFAHTKLSVNHQIGNANRSRWIEVFEGRGQELKSRPSPSLVLMYALFSRFSLTLAEISVAGDILVLQTSGEKVALINRPPPLFRGVSIATSTFRVT